MAPYHDDDDMHMNATLLPSTDSNSNDSASEQSTMDSSSVSNAQDGTSDALRGAIRDRRSENPFAETPSPMPQLPRGGIGDNNNNSSSSNAMRAPAASYTGNQTIPVPVMQHQAPVAFSSTNGTPAGNDFVRVSEQCTATRCLRVQWEAESTHTMLMLYYIRALFT